MLSRAESAPAAFGWLRLAEICMILRLSARGAAGNYLVDQMSLLRPWSAPEAVCLSRQVGSLFPGSPPFDP